MADVLDGPLRVRGRVQVVRTTGGLRCSWITAVVLQHELPQ